MTRTLAIFLAIVTTAAAAYTMVQASHMGGVCAPVDRPADPVS